MDCAWITANPDIMRSGSQRSYVGASKNALMGLLTEWTRPLSVRRGLVAGYSMIATSAGTFSTRGFTAEVLCASRLSSDGSDFASS